MQEPDAERPAGGPTGIGLKLAKGKATAVSAVFRDDKHADQYGKDASKCPVDGHCLVDC